MENKLNTAVAIGGLLIAFASFGYSWHTRSQDKTAEFMAKEAQYKAETSKEIQSIKDENRKELQALKTKFNDHLLENQRELGEIRQELSLISAHVIRAQQQYEYVQSQSKLDNEALKREIIKEMKRK
jgi:hypothetical protein